MRLENLLALTDGKVVNTPFVKQFSNIIFEAKKVKRGDLFIAFDEQHIEEAVINGAYGVMFEKPTQITDTEIAWIKVASLEEALKRLLRFRLIEKEIVVYECNEIIIKLALQVLSEANFIALDGDIKAIYKTLWDLEDLNTILFSPALTSRDLFTDSKPMPTTNKKDTITVMEQTLFETSFVYDDIFYERQLLSPFFIPYLEDLFYFFKTNKINFRLRKFTPIDHFEAVFTNKKFEVKEFGTSDKVLIFEKNTSLIEKEISFLQKQASWAQIVYVIPQHLSAEVQDTHGIIVYKNKNEILNLLKINQFHFALIVGADKEILTKPLSTQAQISLFDFN
jgi:ferrochelatase